MEAANIFWIIVPLIFIGVFVWSSRVIKKRQEDLAASLTRLGFSFDKASLPASSFPFAHLPLFSRGRRQQCSNIARLREQSQELIFCDYRYTVGQGKKSNSHLCNCLCLIGQFDLPDFEIGPEDVFSKIAQAVGYHDIDFSFDEEFSKLFVLRGADEQRIRSLFSPAVMQSLKQNKAARLEAKTGAIVYYSRHQIPAENVVSWLEEARKTLKLFVS